MKKLTIDNKTFNLADIKQLYPAVLVKTGYGDETTEMSLEWIDIESKGRVEITGYGLFIVMNSKKKHTFFYKERELLDIAVGLVAEQIR